MSAARKELHEALCHYVRDTLININKVREFSEEISKWVEMRKTESTKLQDIKNRDNQLHLSFSQVKQSENRLKAFGEFLKNKMTLQTAVDTKRAILKEELSNVLKDTLEGLKELDCFLDAVEKLAVTSPHVFTKNQMIHLPDGISFKRVQVVLEAAQMICPRLLEFKRDAEVFFHPRLQNVEVLVYQLGRYIEATQKICETFENSSLGVFCGKRTTKTQVDLDVDLSEDDIQKMLCHINELEEIRMNQHFRTAFLFQGESCSGFISEFNTRHPRMLQFLKDLEEEAVQLDRMNKGSKISSVAGSSVGAVGGVLSIVGLALIPVTAGVSLALTMTGVGLGITSGVNSAVTTIAGIGVNHNHQKKASEVFKLFMEDVQSLQDCLEKVTNQTVLKIDPSTTDVVVGVGKVIGNISSVGKAIDSLVDAVSAVKLLKNEEVIAAAGKVVAQEGKVLRNVPRVASDIPDIGQAAAKGPLALSKMTRVGFIALNALFIGMDVFFICKDGISLAKGSETEVVQSIRARAALWSSEIDAWEKIRDSLCESLSTSERKKNTLETSFYP